MDTTIFKVIAIVLFLLLFSRRIFDLSLSLFLTSSTLMVSLLALSISALILSIAAIPTMLVGCKIAHRHYAHGVTPQVVLSICGCDDKTPPRVVRSKQVVTYEPRVTVAPNPEKY